LFVSFCEQHCTVVIHLTAGGANRMSYRLYDVI